MKPYHYTTNCVNSTANAINAMTDRAEEVTLKTMRRHCDLTAIERELGYDTGHERGGLRLKDDWHVSYHKSVYRGRPCYYLCHSHIEYIWIKPEASRSPPASSLGRRPTSSRP